MSALSSAYCGMSLYFSNSACQAASPRGGSTPITGFHSVMDRPDWVRRVAPPTTTMAKMQAATAHSHPRTRLVDARRRAGTDGVSTGSEAGTARAWKIDMGRLEPEDDSL